MLWELTSVNTYAYGRLIWAYEAPEVLCKQRRCPGAAIVWLWMSHSASLSLSALLQNGSGDWSGDGVAHAR